jgi:hypothetical protein
MPQNHLYGEGGAATRRERASSLKPKRLPADTAYGTGHFLGWLVGRGIAPHIPVATQASAMTAPFRAVTFAGTDGTASPSVYTPPDRARRQPAPLPRLQIRLQCLCKMRCCPNMTARRVPRDVHKDARDMARRRIGKALLIPRDERKRVEMRFAHLKTHHGFERAAPRSLRRPRRVSPCRHRNAPHSKRFSAAHFSTASTPFRPRAKPDLSQQMRTKAEVRQRLRIYESLGCCGSCQRC